MKLLAARKDHQDNARFKRGSPQCLCSDEDKHIGETHYQDISLGRGIMKLKGD